MSTERPSHLDNRQAEELGSLNCDEAIAASAFMTALFNQELEYLEWKHQLIAATFYRLSTLEKQGYKPLEDEIIDIDGYLSELRGCKAFSKPESRKRIGEWGFYIKVLVLAG